MVRFLLVELIMNNVDVYILILDNETDYLIFDREQGWIPYHGSLPDPNIPTPLVMKSREQAEVVYNAFKTMLIAQKGLTGEQMQFYKELMDKVKGPPRIMTITEFPKENEDESPPPIPEIIKQEKAQ